MIVDINEKLDRERISPFQLRVVVLCTLVALLDGIDVQVMALVAPAIAGEWGVERSSFGPVLSAGLAGVMVGAMGGGLLGDRYGRRGVLIAAFLLVAVSSLLSALAQSHDQLMLCRLVTGAGIGACMPNFTALTAEYVPPRRQSFYVTVLFSAVAVGGVAAGFLAPPIMEAWGWRAVFVAAGLVPLIISVALIAWLPESLTLLARREAFFPKIGKILERAAPPYQYEASHHFATRSSGEAVGIKGLLAPSRAASTLTLWGIFFCSLFGLFLLTSWLPSIMVSEGWSVARASQTVSCFFVGGFFGGLAAGWLIDRTSAHLVLLAGFALDAVLTAMIGQVDASTVNILTLAGLAGFAVVGSQTGMTALAAKVYPTEIRAAGVGWGLGVGRLGAVLSPLLGGFALAAHWPRSQLFLVGALPALACVAGVGVLWAIERKGQLSQPAEFDEA